MCSCIGPYLGQLLQDLQSDQKGAVSALMFGIANELVRPHFGGTRDQDPEDFLDGLLRQLDKEESAAGYVPGRGKKSTVRMLYEGETANRVRPLGTDFGVH